MLEMINGAVTTHSKILISQFTITISHIIISYGALSFVVQVLTNYTGSRYCIFPMTKTICTSLSLQSVFLYQLQPHAQCEHIFTITRTLTRIHKRTFHPRRHFVLHGWHMKIGVKRFCVQSQLRSLYYLWYD